MTSEERKEKRYYNRKRKRDRNVNIRCGKRFEDVFNYENMLSSAKSCCTGVRWKSSTINFETSLITQTLDLFECLMDGSYQFRGFKHFKTIEHGKERDINALDIHDRVIQKCYCDFLMTDAYSKSFIYDNSASLPGKGMDFTLRRMKKHLIRHYHKHGLEGGIYQFDFHGYFASIPHDIAKIRLCKRISDPKLQQLGC